jgi:hypothetical protein
MIPIGHSIVHFTLSLRYCDHTPLDPPLLQPHPCHITSHPFLHTSAQRHRLSELSEQHSDLLGLLAQQEVELGVFRAALSSQVECANSSDSPLFFVNFSFL